ncbi:MAG TPA: metalloregulator ArsR/SmtB family transcription factor [Solirubrobacteraceae bacterium]|jgi:DNA-binding transcriptional ArsR family regulator|nr:metalloregulator ArsR/SmtB family transcription factor [Solirubrobacteraceae bacterium]
MTHGVQGHTTRGTVTAADAELIAGVMQALATPSRVLILAQLREGTLSVSELVAAVGMQQSAVSHQLRLLRDLGLVVGERTGRRVVYSLYDDHVALLIDQAMSHLEHLRLGAAGRSVRRAS